MGNIPFAHTIRNPGTVMVIILDTHLTHLTMLRSVGLQVIAVRTYSVPIIMLQ